MMNTLVGALTNFLGTITETVLCVKYKLSFSEFHIFLYAMNIYIIDSIN